MKKKNLLFTIFISIIILSCSSNNSNDIIITIDTSDITFTIDENPDMGQEIGAIRGITNQGSILFSVISQTPNDAFTIDATTGKLTVLNELLFDFETNPTITGVIRVANGEIFRDANVTINLNDIDETYVYNGNVVLTTQEEINSFGANNYITINGNLTIDEDQTIHNIVFTDKLASITKINGVFTVKNMYNLLDLPGFESVISVGGIVISDNWGILDIHSLSNITSISGSITITNNPDLGGLCGIRPLLQSGSFNGSYTVSGNNYNPTQQEIIDGSCEDF